MRNIHTSTDSAPSNCPHCGAKMHLIRVDRIKYYEADCGQSNIGGICEHILSEEETQECRIMNQLPPDVIRELQHFGGRDVVDLVAALVKADRNTVGRMQSSIVDRVDSINRTHGVQDADAIITEMLRGVGPIVEGKAS